MLTPAPHPPQEGEPAAALDRAHHDHGPLDPDDFNADGELGYDDRPDPRTADSHATAR